MSVRQQKLPIQTLERIDDLCAQFEHQWQNGEQPKIDIILEGWPKDSENATLERSVLLAELVLLEIDYRRRRGENPGKEEYLKRFPLHQSTIEETLAEPVAASGSFRSPSIHQLAPLFPKLQIEKLIGAGGMGAVYQARQTGLDRIVALKILPEELAKDVKFAMRFTREARTLAKLNHPNIVSVFEFGSVEDTFYFLMEFVQGTTLRDVVQGQTLAPEQALAIIPHLCDALQYAHDQGVIHRDIKPENILMGTDGSVKIADFGLSRILGSEEQPGMLTGTHQVMGTPRYMAPEQFEGTRSVDHRADIYSLGVVFYEMLTGELPIGRFAAPSQKVQIDVRLDEVVLRTLEKEPQKRYQFASHIKSDVQSIANSSSAENVATQAFLGSRPSDASPATRQSPSAETSSLRQQEIAGRLLLTRRQLLERVKNSFKPLFRGQIFQIFIGISLIALGAYCWGPNTHIPHKLTCGIIVHLYGILVIAAAGTVVNRISRIDYSKPIIEVRKRIGVVRTVYLRFGNVIGVPWWLMWIPVCVAAGFDQILLPNVLLVSVFIGTIGMAITTFLIVRLIAPRSEKAESYRKIFAGKSIAKAYLELEEIEKANIQ